ncbi:hypothetical protein, partial [Mesorhizobium sp.]
LKLPFPPWIADMVRHAGLWRANTVYRYKGVSKFDALEKHGKSRKSRVMRAIGLSWRAARVAQFLRQNGYSGYASQIIGISMIPTRAF